MIAVVFGIILFELLVVAWIDLKTRKIANLWALVNIVLSISFHVFFQALYSWSWETLIFPLGFIVVGFILFILNVMGAGDSKYLASLFLVVPAEFHLLFFEKLLLATVFIGAVLLTYRVLKNFGQVKAYLLSRYWAGVKSLIKSRFSYAPVILIAWILLGVDQWR